MAARTLPGVGVSPIDVYMTESTRPGLYIYNTTDSTTTNQSYVGGVMHMTDATTKAAGTSYGVRFRMATSGTKTGGTVNAVGVRLSVGGNTSVCNALSIYTAVGAYTTDFLRGIYMYMDTCTTAPSSIVYCLDIGIVGTGLSSVGHFIRMYNHGTDPLLSVFTFDNAAQDIATSLFTFGAADQLPLSASTTGEAVTQKVACLVGGAVRYLHLHSQ